MVNQTDAYASNWASLSSFLHIQQSTCLYNCLSLYFWRKLTDLADWDIEEAPKWLFWGNPKIILILVKSIRFPSDIVHIHEPSVYVRDSHISCTTKWRFYLTTTVFWRTWSIFGPAEQKRRTHTTATRNKCMQDKIRVRGSNEEWDEWQRGIRQ